MAYAIITGGGKIGYYLARSLINNDYEVLLMEKDAGTYRRLSADLGDVVMHGDACDPLTLKAAGIERADVLVAATGDDADNLITCQLATHCFGRVRVIARVNNPDNQGFSSAWACANASAARRPFSIWWGRKCRARRLCLLGALERSNIEAVELILNEGSPLVGAKLSEINLPEDTLIISILREGHAMLPNADTVFAKDDVLIALIPPDLESALREYIV
jgi:trk system potassium uptake protein TrkA